MMDIITFLFKSFISFNYYLLQATYHKSKFQHIFSLKTITLIKTNLFHKVKSLQLIVTNQMKIIVLLLFVVQTILSIETTILEHLTKTDQQTLIVAHELFNLVQSQRYLQSQPFTCLTLLPSNLTKNQKQKVYKLNLTFNYRHQQTQANQQLATNIPSQQKIEENQQITEIYQDYDYDKILDLLHGTCAIHETNEFLYEYCHKQKVRQFDNINTLQRMGKKSYEDIGMGYYNYQEALKKSKSDQDKPLKPGNGMYQIKYSQNGDLTVLGNLLKNFPDLTQTQRNLLTKTIKQNLKNSNVAGNFQEGTQKTEAQIVYQTIPTRSVIYDKKNLFTVSDINHKEYELNKDDKVIHLNYPIIKGNKYFTAVEYTHEVTCQHFTENGKVIYISKAVVISFFDLAFLGNVSKCDKVIDISFKPIEERHYQSPFYMDKFREVDDFLFGYVDQFCTNNWDWDMDRKNDFLKERNNYLEPGNTLWLQMVTNVSGALMYAYESVTVKKVIAPGVIKIEQNIREKLMNFKSKTAKTQKDTAWINSCRVISKNPILYKSLNYQNKILRKNIIKVKEDAQKQGKKPGDQILCLCNFKKYNEDFLEMHLTLGNKFISANSHNNMFSYFKFYQKRTVKTAHSDSSNLFEMCAALLCYDIAQPSREKALIENKKVLTSSNHFTQIHKFTSSQPILTEDLLTEEQVLIIDVSQNGMLKIHTEVDGQKYLYLISTSMLFKIKLFPNGTKQIIRQNSFYENQTTYNYVSWLGNSIFIHKNYIWRGYDKIVFPRMNMGRQMIIKIERISGYGYLRKWNLSNMKNQDSLYLSTIEKHFEEHFRVKTYPLFVKNSPSQIKITDQAKITEAKIEKIVQNNEQNAIEADSLTQNLEKMDFSKVDFSKSQFKPLNKSVSVRYQYFHGDFCGQPINKHRRTNVDLQCGEPWLKIEQVKEVSPCIYELKVSTRLLCRQDYYKTVQKVSALNKNTDSRIKLQKGLVCYPQDAWDNVMYVYDVGKKDVYFTLK